MERALVILLVDNQGSEISKKTIEDLGYQCLVARNRQEVLAIAKKEPIDLGICTIRDKGENFTVFDEIKAIRPTCQSIAILDASLEEYFPQLLVRAYPRNLIANNHPPDYLELGATIQKMVTGDIFGIEKYGVPVQETIEVTSSDQKYKVIEKVRDFYLKQGIQGRLTGNVEIILNELLMNAIFDAPINEKGEQIYYRLDRSAVFPLKPHERPKVQYGINEDRLAVSVSDPFGTFGQDTFLSCVNRCYAEKGIDERQYKGAGMGLFMAFKSLNQLVIDVEYHKKTEVIALIDYHFSVGELKKRRRSFHHFHLGEFKKPGGGK